ncbi:MAG TPA: DUF2520 domain-containing protein [Solirubrobacterales bacterium]|nr:DUF2520 domain-containing protein [Solirubrobacterales bacterium]
MNPTETALRAPVIVGPGKVGSSLHAAFSLRGAECLLLGRSDGLDQLGGRVVLLAVPDASIAGLADRIGTAGGPPALIGHTSGATGLAALAGAGAGGSFSLHPLQTVPDCDTDLTGCPAAIAGSTPEALDTAREMATMIGMRAFEVSESDRAVYHAAASIASNFLITVEQTASELLDGIEIGDSREILEPLVRRSLDNWLEDGSGALTGPIVRGDETTVDIHRRALIAKRPDLLDFYDTLADRTRSIAAGRHPA